MPAVKFQTPEKDSDGTPKIRFVPAKRSREAYDAGGKVLPLEQQDVKHPGFWSTLYDDVKGMEQGLQHLADPDPMINPNISHAEKWKMVEQQEAAAAAKNAARVKAHGQLYSWGASANEMLGVNVAGEEKSAEEGDVGGVAGHAAAVPAVMAATEGIARGVPAVVGSVKSGALRPVAATALRTAADVVSPEVTGVISPRAAHLQRLAGRLADVLAQPEKNFVDPGAPNPATPPREVLQASSLGRGAQPVIDPAAGLSQIPVRQVPPGAAGSMVESVAAPQATPSAATAPETPTPIRPTSRAALGRQLDAAIPEAMGVEPPAPMKPGVSLKNQIKADIQAQTPLPKGFTPVEGSSAIKGYKYNGAQQEMETITQNGQHYIHGGVDPDQAATFEATDSKGTAWNDLRKAPGVVRVAKVINGQRVAFSPSAGSRSMMIDPETGQPELASIVEAKQAAAKTAASKTATPKPPTAAAADDLTSILQESLKAVKAAKK